MRTREFPAWDASRRRLAGVAVLIAVATAMTGALLVGSAGPLYGAAYVTIAIIAVITPSWIPAQVVAGQLFVAISLFALNQSSFLTTAAMVAGVISTAELLAAAARMDAPLGNATGEVLRRSALAALAGGSVYVAVSLIARLPGPSGLLGVGIASSACVLVAMMLSRSSHA